MRIRKKQEGIDMKGICKKVSDTSLVRWIASLTLAMTWAVVFAGCSQDVSYDEGSGYIEIRSAEDFGKIGKSADYPLDGDYRIPPGASEIRLADWIPIGGADQPFTGKFFGNGGAVTIEGFTTTGSYLGLFGYLRDAEVTDLTVTVSPAGEITLAGDDNKYAGALAGYISGGTVKNISAAGTLRLAKTGPKSLYAGGVAGYATGASIEDSASGLTLYASSERDIYAGGLAGYAAGLTTASNSSALGDITAIGGESNAAYTGGLIGYADGGSGLKLSYTNYTNGTVSAAAYSVYSGGIVGYAKGAEISESYTSGTVKAEGSTPFAGGIAAYLGGGSIRNAYTLTKVSSKSATSRALAGGIAGGVGGNGEISKSYATADVSAENTGSLPGPTHAAPEGSHAGGIAGALYGESPSVRNSAVLEGAAVSAEDAAYPPGGQNLKAYRIAAMTTGTLTGNIAYHSIPLNGRTPDDKGGDKPDGEDTTLSKPGQSVYTELGWDFTEVWRMGKGGYPVLTGQPVNIGDYIEITTGEQLALIGVDNAYPLNGSYRIPAGTPDITLTNWTSIGTEENPFTGDITGNGTTVINITDFTVKALDGEGIGLFGYVKGSLRRKAALKDLKVEITMNSTYILNPETPQYAAVLVGYGEELSIENVTVSGRLRFSKGSAYCPLYSGGVAAYLKNGRITGCASSVAVETKGQDGVYSGGILGYAICMTVNACTSTGAVTTKAGAFNSSAGGIVGYILGTSGSTVSNCAASGNVRLTPATGKEASKLMFYCGGVAGYAGGGAADNGEAHTGAVIENSRYTGGTVYCKTGYPYAGGVIGYNYTYSIVRACYATGTVTAEGSNLPYAGGVAGYVSAAAKLENSYSRALVNARSTSKQALAGGVAGAVAKPSLLSKCYATGAVTAQIDGSGTDDTGGSLGVRTAANAGGISGSVYFANPKVEKSAALNSSVTGTDTGSGGTLYVYRIGGLSPLSGSPVVENNIAWSGMTLTGGDAGDKGTNGQDGADCAEKPEQSVYEGLDWDFATIWKMGNDGYPALRWE
jgi:hypothetical protein